MKRNNRRRGRRRTEKKNTPPYLPDELIIQILLRLPVKSLTRFKCVCKSWFSLISDTDFANSHFQITASTNTPKILFILNSASHETRSLDFEASPLDDDSASVSLNSNFMPFKSYSYIEIKGSCRGFLLLHCYSERTLPMYWIYDIYLWNPSTGFHKKIPSSRSVYHPDDYTNFYGFGYDHSTDDYLLVSLSYDANFNNNVSSHLEIFSLRVNVWKEIEGTHIPYTSVVNIEPRLGLFCNGAINWIIYHEDLAEDVIVAFDLMERKLLQMHLPEGFTGELKYSGLWVFEELLNLWTMMNDDDNAIQIWVMKEYKVDSSWTKTHVLSVDGIPDWHFSPLCYTESGDIIGTEDDKVIKYNNKGQWLDFHYYCNDSDRSQVTLYIESLLSLPADNAQA